MRNSLLTVGVLAVLLVAGCGDHNKAQNFGASGNPAAVTNPDAPRNEVIVTGRVIDNMSRAGIPNGTVAFRLTETDIRTTGTLGNSGNTGFDQSGGFTIVMNRQDVPDKSTRNNTFTIAVSAPGYVTRKLCVTVPGLANDQTPDIADMGLIEMSKSISFQVLATLDGKALGNVTLFAIDRSEPFTCSAGNSFNNNPGNGQESGFDGVELTAVTDGTTGIATFTVDPLRTYDFILPAQALNGSAVFNSFTRDVEVTHPGEVTQPVVIAQISETLPVSTITLQQMNLVHDNTIVGTGSDDIKMFSGPLVNVGPPGNIFSNGNLAKQPQDLTAGSGSPVGAPKTPFFLNSTSVQLVFSVPVDIVTGTQAPGFHFFDDLTTPSTTNAGIASAPGATTSNGLDFPGAERTIFGTTTKLANGTVWVITPASTLKQNETFVLQVFAHNAGNPGSNLAVSTDISSSTEIVTGRGAFLIPFHVPGPALTAATQITADNYNGTTAQAPGANTKAQVYLEFPTFVQGTYKLLKQIDASTTPPFPSVETDFPSDQPVNDLDSFATDSTVLRTGVDTESGRGAMIFTDGAAGAGALASPSSSTHLPGRPGNSIRYIVPLTTGAGASGPALLANDNATNVSTVTLEIFAQDLLGNTVSGNITVQVN